MAAVPAAGSAGEAGVAGVAGVAGSAGVAAGAESCWANAVPETPNRAAVATARQMAFIPNYPFAVLGSGLNVPEAKSPVHYGFEMARCRRNVPGLGLVEALSRR